MARAYKRSFQARRPDEGLERLSILERNGPTQDAFSFAHRFASPDGQVDPVVGERDVCPA